MSAEPEEWTIEPLARRHVRERFDCGVPELNEFLKQYARQNEKHRISRTYVAVLASDPHVLGYFTLRTGAVGVAELSDKDAKRLPKYPVPVIHLARLAVDVTAKGKGLGGLAVAAFVLFLVAALSDFLDGYVARQMDQESQLGRVLDPFVDKLLVLGAMVFLCAMDRTKDFLPAWIVVRQLSARGSRCSQKNRAVTSLAERNASSPPPAASNCDAFRADRPITQPPQI